MLGLDQVLVVDGSRFVRDLLTRLMKRHSNATHATGDCRDARQRISGNPDISLVICDLEAPGGGGFELLEFVAGLPTRRPRVLLVGRRFDATDRARARSLGAIGCVTRPVSFRAIARAVAASGPRPFSEIAPRRYASPPARAQLLDPDALQRGEPHQQISWALHDLSSTGALIDTRGPIPVGTPLRVALCVGEERLQLDCEVVRVQEPAWETLPGVGVRFVGLAPEVRAALERELQRIGEHEPA
jgi:CheY-like chemotaxis protein